MRKLLILVLLAFIAIPAAASAKGVHKHICAVVPGGGVTASGYTSCSFASSVAKEFNHAAWGPSTAPVHAFYVYSPITGQNYHVTCRFPRGFMAGDEIHCTASGVDSWVRFFYFPLRHRNRFMPLETIGMPKCGG